MFVLNALRNRAGLPYITKDDLPSYDEVRKGYYMPAASKLLTARRILKNGGKI